MYDGCVIQDQEIGSDTNQTFSVSRKLHSMLDWAWFGGLLGLQWGLAFGMKRSWSFAVVALLFAGTLVLAAVFSIIGLVAGATSRDQRPILRVRRPISGFAAALAYGLVLNLVWIIVGKHQDWQRQALAGGIASLVMALVAAPYGRPVRTGPVPPPRS